MNLPFMNSSDKAPKISFGDPPFADLIPPRSRAAREVRELKRKWFFWGFVGLALIVALCFASFGLKLAADAGLNTEKDNQASLTSEIASYSDVNSAINGIRDLETKRKQALLTETKWVDTYNRVASSVPAGTKLTSFSAVAGGSPSSETATGLAFIATVSSSQPIAYSDMLLAFSAIEGVENVQVGDLTKVESGYSYTVAFGFDNSVFTNKFNPQQPKESKDN